MNNKKTFRKRFIYLCRNHFIMFKKAQIHVNIIVYVIAIVAISLVLLLGIEGAQTLKKTESASEINSFVITFENSLKNQRVKGIGSVEPISFSLPSSIETVCFIDEKESFSPESFLLLNKEKEIYQDRNIFFFPSDKFTPSFIKDIKLKESINPLCVNTIDGKLNLKLTTQGQDALIEAVNKEDTVQDCVVVPGSEVGDPDEKIDIVFLSYGYNNRSVFAEDVNDYINNYLFVIEPFYSNKGKFNIWMIDNKQPDCSITSYIFCDSLSVNKITSNCPNDYVFILVDKRRLSNSVRSSAISNMAKINTRDNKLVLLHELGHSLGNLADEYTDSYYDSWFNAKNYPNCDLAGCSSWSSVNGTECIKGCSTNSFYRSIPVSIMRDYDKSSEYGLLNEMIIKEILEEYP
jgi:hypothetical protein